MDHLPDEDMPTVAKASHEVVQKAMNAGVVGFSAADWKPGGERRGHRWDGTDGPYPEAIGGFCVVDVPSREDALEWAVKNAGACRCAQEVREFMPDLAVGN